MRNSKSSCINFIVIYLLGFSVIVYILMSRCFSISSIEKGSEKIGEIMLNGVKLSDLQEEVMFPTSERNPIETAPSSVPKTLQMWLFVNEIQRSIGQNFFELAAHLGIAKTLGRVPDINSTSWFAMSSENPSDYPFLAAKFWLTNAEPSSAFSANLNTRYCCKYDDPQNLKSISEQQLTIRGVYFRSFKYFEGIRSEIRNALTPSPSSSLRAELQLPEDYRKDFIICVHTKQILEQGVVVHSKPSDPFFTRTATDFLVSKYKSKTDRVTVAILGNDPIWSHNLFYDKIGKSSYFGRVNNSEYIFPRNSPDYTALLTLGISTADDVAFSRHFCDVVLMTAPTSSFGWWLAYLAKDTADIYYRDPSETSDQIFREMNPIDYYPHSWNKLQSSQLQIPLSQVPKN